MSDHRTAVIMRGLPGSGKSTMVYDWLRECSDMDGPRTVVASADHYFMANGVYSFRPRELTAAHAQCLRVFTEAIDDGIERVILDNTNIKRSHYEPYIYIATKSGYQVVMVTMMERSPIVCFNRCEHNVPLATIVRMAEEFENA